MEHIVCIRERAHGVILLFIDRFAPCALLSVSHLFAINIVWHIFSVHG